jgi:hypothetical protein
MRPLAYWDCGFESSPEHGGLFIMSVVCCQVEVSVSGWSLVQRSPTECSASGCDREVSTMRRRWPTRGCCAVGRKKNIRTSMNDEAQEANRKEGAEKAVRVGRCKGRKISWRTGKRYRCHLQDERSCGRRTAGGGGLTQIWRRVVCGWLSVRFVYSRTPSNPQLHSPWRWQMQSLSKVENLHSCTQHNVLNSSRESRSIRIREICRSKCQNRPVKAVRCFCASRNWNWWKAVQRY